MNTIPLIRGVTQAGRFYLTRREQQRAIQNNWMLENLKNAMWQKRLKEETDRQRFYQQRLLEQYKSNQEAEVRKAEIKADLEREEWERDKPLRDLELQKMQAGIEDLRNKAEGRGYYAKKSKGIGRKEKSTELSDLLKIQKVFASKKEKTDADKMALKGIEDKLREFGVTHYGISIGTTGRTGIQGKSLKETALNYYDQLVAGGIPEKTASIMTQQRFSSRNQRMQQPKVKKSLQEMSLDELYNELQKNE